MGYQYRLAGALRGPKRLSVSGQTRATYSVYNSQGAERGCINKFDVGRIHSALVVLRMP